MQTDAKIKRKINHLYGPSRGGDPGLSTSKAPADLGCDDDKEASS